MCNKSPQIILIHGYTGSPVDLQPLATHLIQLFGPTAVHTIRLIDHDRSPYPPFDAERFIEQISRQVNAVSIQNSSVVIVGHSTGGTLALAAIAEKQITPDLLILAGTPKQVDGSSLARWEKHSSPIKTLKLGDMARMVSLINRVGRLPVGHYFPIWVIHGQDDQLVPAEDALRWGVHPFSGPIRKLLIPKAGHHLFKGRYAAVAIDAIARAIHDVITSPCNGIPSAIDQLKALEGNALHGFLKHTPTARNHALQTPSAHQALKIPFDPKATAAWDPLQINIEVTTRCNLRCTYCARTIYTRPPEDMPESHFAYLLDLLPNSYRVVLAGLGEPTLHPQITDFVRLATERKRHISIVSNATHLTLQRAQALINAGLNGITFSLDSVDDNIAARVRPGMSPQIILKNIQTFTSLARSSPVATAVFTAVSAETLKHLPQLAQAIAISGVDAWMVTDLNFEWNRCQSLAGQGFADAKASIKAALKVAFSYQLPVLSVQGLEALGLAVHYLRYLLYPPQQLFKRTRLHTACKSPWQTLAVDVQGNVTQCDCQPQALLGNLYTQSLSSIWNGEAMRTWRRRMVSDHPPKKCVTCPRF